MVERGELWNRKGMLRDRRGVPSAWPTRATGLLVENQIVAIINVQLVQYIDFRVVRYCSKEGI